jgi:hypothetical protein
MAALTVARANQIVDRISGIAESGGFLQPVALSSTGASTTTEALAALYLVTAETFQTAALNDSPENQALLQQFIGAAGGTGTWIVMFFRQDAQSQQPEGIDESVRETETIESFVKFLRSLDPTATDYWERVYSRIGAEDPTLVSSPTTKQSSTTSWWRRLFG